MHQYRCPFVLRLQYCYAAAQVQVIGKEISVTFSQEINLEDSEDAIKFLLMPIADLETFDCDYILTLTTPGKTYNSYHICISNLSCAISILNKPNQVVPVSLSNAS